MKIEQEGIKQITEEKFINLFSVPYTDTKGVKRTWGMASRRNLNELLCSNKNEKPEAIVIASVHDSGCIVVTKEFRVPLGDYEYGFPAGLIDYGESLESCAKRELFEECGLTLLKMSWVSPPIYSSAGMTDESIILIACTCTGTPTSVNTGESEEIETMLWSQEKAKHKLEGGGEHKFGSKAWPLLLMFARYGEL